MKTKCAGHNNRGEPCGRYPIAGSNVCLKHGAAAPQVRTRAAIRAELNRWGLGDHHIDPGETLLRLVSQSASRAQMYADELKHLVDESPTLREALVAETWVPTEAGSLYKAGEYIRGLATAEAQERDRLAGFCVKAISAGLAERQVRVAEQQGQLVADIMRKVLGDASLGLTSEQRAAVPDVLRRHVLAISA